MHFDITPSTWQFSCFAGLALAKVIAVEVDRRERRIPNVLVLLLASGIALNGLGPDNGRGGLFNNFPGALGAGVAVLGALTGLALFLPLYGLRAMGAGDVKLMAGIGSFVGPATAVNLALFILVTGGVLAVARMVWARKSRQVMANVVTALGQMLPGSALSFDPATQSADRMSYGVAMAGGLLAYGAWIFSGRYPIVNF